MLSTHQRNGQATQIALFEQVLIMADRIFAAALPQVIQGPMDFVGEALHAGGYSLQNSVNGVGQLFGAPECRILQEHKPANASEWCAQQIGFGCSTALQFWALGRLVGGGYNRACGRMLVPTLGRDLAVNATTGAIFGGAFVPIANNDPRNFWVARAENAAIMGGSLAAMGLADRGARVLGQSLNHSYPMVGGFLRSPVGSGMVSGIPGGLVHTAGIGLAEGRVPTWREWLDNTTNFVAVGGLLGAAQRGRPVGGLLPR